MAEAEAQTHAEKWITVAEAAHELKKSERTIRRQCEAGKLRGRLDKTDSGKTWMVCLAPVEDVTESVTEGQTQATSSTRSEDAAAKAADIIGTAAIVPTHEMTAVAAPVITADNSEILAEVSEVKEQVEQIKSFLAGQMSVQMSAQMDERLSALPTRDDFREDVAALMGSALTPVMQRLEELASENAQLQNELHNEKQKTLAQVRRPWWKKLFT